MLHKRKIWLWQKGKMLAIIWFLFLWPLFSNAQFYYGLQQDFGRSRVTYSDFLWTYYMFDDFDTYFYLNGEQLAWYVGWMAEKDIKEISGFLGASLQNKMQFIIFNRLSDMRQSNIGSQQEAQYDNNTGGITHIIGRRVFLYFDGDYNNFNRQIRAGIARILLEQAFYGGSIGNQITSTGSQSLPEWYISGLVSYLSDPWNTEIESIVRNAFQTNKYRRFNQLTGLDAMYAGHSIWKFIADRYGENIITNLVYMSRMGRSVDNSLIYVLGINLKTLMAEWEKHYSTLFSQSSESLTSVPQTIKLRNRKNEVYQNIKLNPDGRHIAYVSNHNGRYRVILQNLVTGKRKVVKRGGYRIDEVIDYSFPLLAWHPMGDILAIIVEDKGLVNLTFRNIVNKDRTQQYLFNFDKIIDFSYTNDGFNFLMSAVQKGHTNIYNYHIPSNSFQQITGGVFDDHSPSSFMDNNILFSSNRPVDSLSLINRLIFQPTSSTHNLFIYNSKNRRNPMQRLVYEPLWNQTDPMEYSKGHFSYLSDEGGIVNRFIGRYDSIIAFVDTITHYRYFVESMQVTDYPGNITSYDINQRSGQIGEFVLNNGKYHLRISPLLYPDEITPVERKVLTPEAAAAQLRRTQAAKTGDEETQRPKRFRTVMSNEIERRVVEIAEELDSEPPADSIITEKEYPIETVREDTIPKFVIPKRLIYNTEYFIDQMVNQVNFNYLGATYQPFTGATTPIYLNPPLNLFFSVSVTDLLENYRITAGVRLNFNFVNNEYILSFANNRKRLNKEYVFYRKTLDEFRQLPGITYRVFLIRHRMHNFNYILTYPFTRVFSIRTSLVYKYDNAVFLSTDQLSLQLPNQVRNWLGAKAELIYDDTKSLGTNLLHGTRAKLFGEYYQGITQDNTNMVVLGLDVRHYLPIHRSFIWANRFATSTSFGKNMLIYYMGGVDNWVFPKFDPNQSIDFTKPYAYQTLATNMRGFPQNIRNGNSFMVINSELRFPVFRYLLNRPINLKFIEDFQIVGFADFGTAWTGLHPYSDENHLYRKYFNQPPVSGYIEIQRDPFVTGVGFGGRTTILGYFIRADVGWGLDEKRFRDPIFYFSLGTDF